MKMENKSPCGFQAQCLEAHMKLLCLPSESGELQNVSTSPIFTGGVGSSVENTGNQKSNPHEALIQYGLLARDISENVAPDGDARVFYNVAAPSSVFICGSQGSGKSHTLATLLENCLVKSEANVLPRPLSGLVFHYDTTISDSGGHPCEAAYLSSHQDIQVRILCAPTNLMNIKVRPFAIESAQNNQQLIR